MQVRGRKLYVLCAPKDHALVAPAGKSADEGGSTRQARFDPLDAGHRAELEARGLTTYATVLQPGETIVAPDSWWHYAVSLTPSITLMCNFWDRRNRAGFRTMFVKGMKPMPSSRPRTAGPVTLRAVKGVVLHTQATDDAPVLHAMARGETAVFDAETDDGAWLRTARPVGGTSRCGWASMHSGSLAPI